MAHFINQEAKVIHISHPNPSLFVEDNGRVCYQSHDKMCPGSDIGFCGNLLRRGHATPFEFVDVVAELITDRTISHEIVRHRMASPLQESQRYCRYDKNGVTFILPRDFDINLPEWQVWHNAMHAAESSYLEMISYGAQPQQARKVLPGSTATKLRFKANLREWMHIFSLRDNPAADPDMQVLMADLHEQFRQQIPAIYK